MEIEKEIFYKNYVGIPVYFKDFQPCDHNGCRAHISHPCEVCGRINARGEIYIDSFDYEKKINNNQGTK